MDNNFDNIIEINDLAAPELEVFSRLTDAALRERMEPERGVFVAESVKVIELALDAGCAPVSFLMERGRVTGQARGLIARSEGVPVYTADGHVLAKLTGYPLTRGVLCAMRRPRLRGLEEVCAGARRIAVLEDITDSTNVGAIFRCAAALGMDAALITPSCSDPLNRRSVRVSMGAVLLLPWAYACDKPSRWPRPGIDSLRELGFKTVAMAISDNAVSIDDPRLVTEEKLAIVLGTEGDGLKARTIAECDYIARIPMSHNVDSLNVAAASAIAFWQLGRRAGS